MNTRDTYSRHCGNFRSVPARSFAWAWLLLCALLCGTRAQAQWRTETYNLKGGWNAIYLHGDATHASLDTLFPNTGTTANVLEIWRWNTNPTQVQFINSPLQPTPGTPEWSVWKRGGTANTLTQMLGQSAYLVKCAGPATNTFSITIKQRPLPPTTTWVRNGANLLGFPTLKNGSSFPAFSSYFASFPAVIAANTKIFKYVGGDFSATNPQQLFSPAAEQVDRNQAYWFGAAVVGNFYAPVDISLSNFQGLDFGRTGATIKVLVRNRTSAPIIITLAPVPSESSVPLGQTGITGPVPLTKRTFNPTTLLWEETAISAAYTETIGGLAAVELTFGINRPAMTGASDAFYASFLRLTDNGGLFDIFLPARATKTSLAGLWIGDISLTGVSNYVANGAQATASVNLNTGVLTSISVKGTGGMGYTSAPIVSIDPPAPGGTAATATATVVNGTVTAINLGSPGSGYQVIPKVTIALPPPLTGTTTPRAFPLRTLLHVADDGTARLLSKVFLGTLAAAPNNYGICTQESLLKQDAKASAQRLVAAHMPLDQVIGGSGSVALPGTLVRTITVPYNDATNPFVHQDHPDHDNTDARFSSIPLPAGAESPTITRTCSFSFTATPPAGSNVDSGWGSSVIGGTYSEIITGLQRADKPITLSGTFELRRASEIGSIQTQ